MGLPSPSDALSELWTSPAPSDAALQPQAGAGDGVTSPRVQNRCRVRGQPGKRLRRPPASQRRCRPNAAGLTEATSANLPEGVLLSSRSLPGSGGLRSDPAPANISLKIWVDFSRSWDSEEEDGSCLCQLLLRGGGK